MPTYTYILWRKLIFFSNCFARQKGQGKGLKYHNVLLVRLILNTKEEAKLNNHYYDNNHNLKILLKVFQVTSRHTEYPLRTGYEYIILHMYNIKSL